MPEEVIMPALGTARNEGVLLRWLKNEDETLQAGEPNMGAASEEVDVQSGRPG